MYNSQIILTKFLYVRLADQKQHSWSFCLFRNNTYKKRRKEWIIIKEAKDIYH